MKKTGRMAGQVLSSVFKKPATTRYPYNREDVPKNYRVKIKFYPEKCIGCKLCMRDCPSNAITITDLGEKNYQAEFRLDKCIYCSQCVLSCNKGALEATSEFELAQLDNKKLKIQFNAKPQDNIK
jgi:Formate hydrogenlyase subunit 6/NADH:ubiquinone oxidoreductase 23 kD subunit (chain I)